MIDILPAINCADQDFECVNHKLQVAGAFAEWAHLDVADGTFTFNKTWREPERWHEFGTKVKLEAHLMVDHPERIAESWLKVGAKRLIVHLETVTEETLKQISAMAKSNGAEVFLAMGPETSIENLWNLAPLVQGFQVLAVHPGMAGQRFLPLSLEKLRFLRQGWPHSKIEIDGGLDLQMAKLAKEAGANILASATYIFDSSNPSDAYKKLKGL